MIRCAAVSGRVAEPLAGTAPVARRWLAVEQHDGWGRDVVADAGPELAVVARACGAAGVRLSLIRPVRGRGSAGGRRTVLLAETTPGRTTLTTLSCTLQELAGLDLAGPDLPGERMPEPVLLVCGHARRDRCCAIDGRALASQLVGQIPGVWLCSHLGGHRFAPTAVVLPSGYVYGRLDATAALAAMKAAACGEVEPAPCRGRSTWQPAGQVAELAVRELTGERGADALTVADEHRAPGPPVPVPGEPRATEAGERQAPRPGEPRAPGPSEPRDAQVPPSEPRVPGPGEPRVPGPGAPWDARVSPEGGACAGGGEVVWVRHTDGRQWRVLVRERVLPGARPTSCGGVELPVEALVAVEVEAAASG